MFIMYSTSIHVPIPPDTARRHCMCLPMLRALIQSCSSSLLLLTALAFPIPSHEPTVTPDPRQALGALAFS